jgi:pimeloyl-ACP methyl ester carboxylesterase
MKRGWVVFLFVLFLWAGCQPATHDDGEITEDSSVPAQEAPPAETGAFADVNGTRLFYEIRGEGEPLVLISGANMDSGLWDEQMESLAEGFRVLRYDPRGIGKSAVPQTPFAHYEDLHALLQFLGIERANILGFSFGAGVALDLAVAYPENVRSLILVSPGLSSWKDELAPVLAEVAGVASQEGKAKAIEILLSDPSMPPAEEEGARSKMREILDRTPQLFDSEFAYIRFMEPLDPPAEDRLSEISVPTLLVVGERDHASIHENVDRLQENIAGAKKVLIMGVGHMIGLEKPEELRRVVLDFLGTT